MHARVDPWARMPTSARKRITGYPKVEQEWLLKCYLACALGKRSIDLLENVQKFYLRHLNLGDNYALLSVLLLIPPADKSAERQFSWILIGGPHQKTKNCKSSNKEFLASDDGKRLLNASGSATLLEYGVTISLAILMLGTGDLTAGPDQWKRYWNGIDCDSWKAWH